MRQINDDKLFGSFNVAPPFAATSGSSFFLGKPGVRNGRRMSNVHAGLARSSVERAAREAGLWIRNAGIVVQRRPFVFVRKMPRRRSSGARRSTTAFANLS
jgi:hypothetical protein